MKEDVLAQLLKQSNLIQNKTDDIQKELIKTNNELHLVKKEIHMLKSKSKMWGSISGAVVTIAYMIIQFIKE